MGPSFRLVRARPSATTLCIAVAGALVTATIPAVGQPFAEAFVDTATATLGDPIQLRLHLVHAPETKLLLPNLVRILSGTNIAVARVGSAAGTRAAGESTQPRAARASGVAAGYRESFVDYLLKPYALGSHEIPALRIGFVRTSGDTLVKQTKPILLDVVSVREEGEEGLRDISPPKVILGGVPLWLVGILAAVVVVLFVFALLWLLGRRKNKDEVTVPEAPIDYVEEFRRIAALGHVGRGEFKAYYSLLSETLRRFLERAVRIDALEQTTMEISAGLRPLEEESTVREVVNFLGVADLVKFARFIPEKENAERTPETAIAIVVAVERHQQQLAESRRQEAAEQAAADVENGPAGEPGLESVGDTAHAAAMDGDKT